MDSEPKLDSSVVCDTDVDDQEDKDEEEDGEDKDEEEDGDIDD